MIGAMMVTERKLDVTYHFPFGVDPPVSLLGLPQDGAQETTDARSEHYVPLLGNTQSWRT